MANLEKLIASSRAAKHMKGIMRREKKSKGKTKKRRSGGGRVEWEKDQKCERRVKEKKGPESIRE